MKLVIADEARDDLARIGERIAHDNGATVAVFNHSRARPTSRPP
jgi:hypothetical protein